MCLWYKMWGSVYFWGYLSDLDKCSKNKGESCKNRWL